VTQRSASTTGGPPAPVEDATAHRAPPGLAAAAVTAGGAVDFVTSGLADVRTSRPVTVHTTFPWFSMTKIVTAMAAMMLADPRRSRTCRLRLSATATTEVSQRPECQLRSAVGVRLGSARVPLVT